MSNSNSSAPDERKRRHSNNNDRDESSSVWSFGGDGFKNAPQAHKAQKNRALAQPNGKPKYMVVYADQTSKTTILALVSDRRNDCEPFLLASRLLFRGEIYLSQNVVVEETEDFDGWNYDLLRCVKRVCEAEALEEPRWENRIGLISEVRGPWSLIHTANNKSGNWRLLDFDVRPFDFVECVAVILRCGIQLAKDFILPENFKSGVKHDRSNNGTEVVHRADISDARMHFPLRTRDDLDLTCEGIGLGLKAHAANIRDMGSDFDVWSNLRAVGGKNYEFEVFPPNLHHAVSFKALWTLDATVLIRREEKGKALAIGNVRSVRHHEDGQSLQMLVTIAASPFPEVFVDLGSGEEYLMSVPPAARRIETRAESWLDGSIGRAMEGDGMHAELIKTLLGLGNTKPSAEKGSRHAKLNQEQNDALALLLDSIARVIALLAPPGTGKTWCLAQMANLAIEEGETVLCVTGSNISLLKMCEDLGPLVNAAQMLIQSGSARDAYKEVSQKFAKFLLVSFEKDIRDEMSLKGEDKRAAAKYAKNIRKRPKLADDREFAPIVARLKNFRVFYATTAMAESLGEIFDDVSILVVDEASQTPANVLIPIAASLKKLKKIVLAGDTRQLGVYTADLPQGMPAARFDFESCLDYARRLRGVDQVRLVTNYRSHPFIVECLQKAVYGNDMRPGRNEEERGLFMKSVPLPNPRTPMLIVQAKGTDKRDPHSFSRANELHTELTLDLLDSLSRLLPPNAPIVVICLYTHQARKLKKAGVPSVFTIDGYQAQQSAVVVVVTTKSIDIESEERNALAFVQNEARATVALSRAQHGLVIVGDLDVLLEGRVWRKFIEHALLFTEKVGETYVAMLQAHAESRGGEKGHPPLGDQMGGVEGIRALHISEKPIVQQQHPHGPVHQMASIQAIPQPAVAQQAQAPLQPVQLMTQAAGPPHVNLGTQNSFSQQMQVMPNQQPLQPMPQYAPTQPRQPLPQQQMPMEMDPPNFPLSAPQMPNFNVAIQQAAQQIAQQMATQMQMQVQAQWRQQQQALIRQAWQAQEQQRQWQQQQQSQWPNALPIAAPNVPNGRQAVGPMNANAANSIMPGNQNWNGEQGAANFGQNAPPNHFPN